MGHRANFVIIREGMAKAYEDQYAALGSTYQFAEGPDGALSAAEQATPTNELLEWAFAEAGYLIDYDKHIAIVFGYPDPVDMDLGFAEEGEGAVVIDPQELRDLIANEKSLEKALEQGPFEFLKAISGKWKGWELRWDERGVDAFAGYLKFRDIVEIKTAPASARVVNPPFFLIA
ncbi:MAG: hypothetical protein Q3M24_15880 [Candidatus Electrothrix aestuarii]|uniref:Uncharacterized protein n=1 Tax=Candidatus Electrothrix aestuarii TaxID=3062594 RepID=A0AAU8LR52_9BACT|nr:hypothetical protein [Candidatus Electrothrix aestuarii]